MFQPTDAEKSYYLQFVIKSMAVSSYPAFLELLKNELMPLLPFKMLICGLGYITAEGTIQPHKLISVDFPVGYLQSIGTSDGGFISPTMSNWVQTRQPQLFEQGVPYNAETQPDWLAKVRRYGLNNMISHGVHDLQGRCTSYFCFGNLPSPLSVRYVGLLEMVVPILHATLLKIIEQVPLLGIEPALFEDISPRELELLQWLAAGKTQKEMAAGLFLSAHTIRNHLNRVYAKLGVHKATEALERAKTLGLL
jgi:DNA-binding CsgD family transcriptional regulator